MTRRVALLAALLVLLASCGPRYERTTAQTTTSTASELGAAGGDNQLGEPAGGTQAGGRAGAGVRSGPGTVSGPTTTGGGTGGGSAGTPGSLAGLSYRGVTPTTITIGDMASENINAAAEAFGATGAFPDPVKQVTPIVAWINEHGGVAGRKLQIAWHFRDDLSQDTDDTKMQQACTDFTQDKKVFAVTSIYQGHGMAPCLARSDIALIESGAGPNRNGIPAYDEIGGRYITPNQISVSRYAVSLVEGIAKRGYFKSGKFGLIYMGFPYARAAVQNALLPALRRLGVKLTDQQELRPIERASDFAGTQAEVSNAVLRFKQKGIDHVISLEDQATTIMTAAEQQDYYPNYGLGSASLIGAAGSNPDSMKNTTLVGTSVPGDVLPRYRGTSPPQEKICRQIYIDSKQKPDDELAWGLMELHCEGLFFLKAALDKMTTLSTSGLIAAVDKLNASYKPITVYGMRVGPGHYDGISMARPLKFWPDCGCIKYAGPIYAIP